MKIRKMCILSENNYGCGASIAAYRLAKSLASKGIEIHYIYIRFMHKINNNKINFHKVDIPFWQKVLLKFLPYNSIIKFRIKLYFNFLKIKKILNNIKPEIINIHNISNILKREDIIELSIKYPIVWTMHDCWPLYNYNYDFLDRDNNRIKTFAIPPKYTRPNSIQKLLSSKLNISFVSPSKWLYELTSKKITKINKNLHLIPNIITKDDFYPENKIASKKQLNLDTNKLQLLFVASDIEYKRKNISILLESIGSKNKSSISLISMGSSSKEFKDKYKDSNITFFDHTIEPQNIRKIYSAADVLVITSLIDNLPNTVLESLLCGTPVIGANVGGIPEMVIPRITGWLFDPYHPDNLVNLFNRINFKRNEVLELQQKCRGWALENFSSGEQTNKYLSLFNSIIQSDNIT